MTEFLTMRGAVRCNTGRAFNLKFQREALAQQINVVLLSSIYSIVYGATRNIWGG